MHRSSEGKYLAGPLDPYLTADISYALVCRIFVYSVKLKGWLRT